MRTTYILPAALIALASTACAETPPDIAPFARVVDYIRDNVHPDSSGNDQILLVRNPDGQSADLILLPNVHIATTGKILAYYPSVAAVTTAPDQRVELIYGSRDAPGQHNQLKIEYLDAREAAAFQWRRSIVLDWTLPEPAVVSIKYESTNENAGTDTECQVDFVSGEWIWGVYTDDDELYGEGTEGLPGPIALSDWRWDYPTPEICREHMAEWPPQ